MTKDIIGIDISDFSIEAVSLSKKGDKFTVSGYSRYRLSPDIVDNGKILDKERLKQALKELLKNGKFLGKKVFISLPESQVFTYIISLPKKLKKQDLWSALKHKAEEFIPVPIDNIIADKQLITTTNDTNEYLYIAVKKDVINSFISLFEEMNMEIEGIVPEAISSLAGLEKDNKDKTVLLLDIGARTTIASVFFNNKLNSSINISRAGDNITKVISAKLDIPYSIAEEKKKEIGLTSKAGDGKIMLISQGQLQPVTDELKRYIKYYESTFNRSIDKIILIGGSAQIKNIDKYFNNNLGIQTIIGKPFIDSKKILTSVDSSKYINALGLAKLANISLDFNLYSSPKSMNISKKFESIKNIKLFSFKDLIDKFKKLFKNIYVLISLGVLILLIILYLFKKPILNLLYKPYILQGEVNIGLVIPGGMDNFVFGEEYNIITEYSQEEPSNLFFTEIVNNILLTPNKYILEEINNIYIKDGYYIIPYILNSELLNTIPLEEDWVEEMPITLEMDYSFMSVSNNSVKDRLLFLNKEQEKYKEYTISSSNYELLEYYEESELFKLKVELELNKF